MAALQFHQCFDSCQSSSFNDLQGIMFFGADILIASVLEWSESLE